MTLEESIETRCIADLAFSNLQQLEIPATPEYYALWYEYHAGLNPSLQHTIDALISNRATFDQKTLDDLRANFLSLEKEKRAIHETSARVLETLKEVVAVADDANKDAHTFGDALSDLAATAFGRTIGNLTELIEELVCESQKMAGRSEYVSIRMRASADKIVALEENLENALRQASVDGLTGVANRKAFDTTLRRFAGEAMNSGDDLALLMIDIDHFKRVNDTWGHPTGDSILRYLAVALQQSVRGEDFVARYGGEEFAILLPRTGIVAAATVADNIRQCLLREPPRLDLVPPMTPITVSIGVANYDHGEPLTEWITRADTALYRAKKEGRDCVRSA